MRYGTSMLPLVLLSVIAAGFPLGEQKTPDVAGGAADMLAQAAGADPAAGGEAPLPSDDELRALAARDAAAARGHLRRAARASDSAPTRGLALRLLAAHDPSMATARICARALRIDPVPPVRRAAAECLGRLGPGLSSAFTPALVAALDDDSLDVLTMAGWALSNVGDAPAIDALVARASHPDVRVARLFHAYAVRMRDRLGLAYDASASPPAVPDGPRDVPPGIALVLPAQALNSAAAATWLGMYGMMSGWFHGALLTSAHGGVGGGSVAPLAGLGFAALGAAAASGYGFSRASTLPLAHTVVQLGTFGTVAGYGAGQLSGFPPSSMVSAANLAFLGSLAGTGLGVAAVETAPPTMGALGAGMVAAVGAGVGSAALARSYRYPEGPAAGVMFLTGGLAGAGTTLALSSLDIGLFPLAGAAMGTMLGGGGGAAVMAFVEPTAFTEASGWLVISGLAGGATAGAVVGLLMPRDVDPLLQGGLKLNPPQLALLPRLGARADAAPVAVLSGSF